MQASNFGGTFDQLFLWIFLWKFLRRCLSTFSIPWCKKVKNDQKLKSRGVLPQKCVIVTVCCIKIETNFVLEWWHVAKNDPLLFWVHWPPVVLLFWWHQQKTDECTFIGCFAKFLLRVWNFSLYNFSDFLEKRFCHHSLSCQFFCHQAIFYTLPATHTTKYFHLEEVGAHLVCRHHWPFRAKVSNSASSSVLSVAATAVRGWLRVCRVFLAQMEGPSSFKVLDIKQWSFFKLSGQFLGWFTLRLSYEAVQRKELLSFYLYLSFSPLPALLSTFPPSL